MRQSIPQLLAWQGYMNFLWLNRVNESWPGLSYFAIFQRRSAVKGDLEQELHEFRVGKRG